MAIEESATIKSAPVQKVDYPRLLPRDYATMDPEQYIAERLNEAIAWYDKSANWHKKVYLRMRAMTVIGGALVPVLVNIDLPYVDILTTILSLVVVLLVSLESVYHFREQWTNYRSTEQQLRNQYFRFTSNDGAYSSCSREEAFRQFVGRIEETIESENAATMKIMTTITEARTRQPNPANAR